jgi:hypothetical protein
VQQFRYSTICGTFFSFFFLLTLLTPAANAGDLGLGLVIGAPIGISGNYFTSQNQSIDAVLAFNFGGHHTYFHSTFLRHHQKTLLVDGVGINSFWGLGARIQIKYHQDDFKFGPRLSGGFLYKVRSSPVDIFCEVALIVDLIENTGLSANLGLGARHYF